MAKDGTNRGGRRVRAGDKPKPLAEKIAAGEDADIIEFTPTALEGADLDDAADLVGEDMPSPSEYLSARQKDGKPLGADEIYKETWIWLKNRGCEKLVNKRLLESYSLAFARFIQCEDALSTYEKYAFRCFLLRLGMIGADYKAARKVLLRNLTGSSAFRHGKPEGGADDAVSE